MTLITLLTDFGTRDEYVGVMKGVIAGINPNVRIVDISHHIEPQNIIHGALMLAAAYPYFPAGTVHVAIVDPGVGGMRRILAAEYNRQRFVVPDNGLMEQVLKDRSPLAAVSVEDPRFFLDPVSCTFHGRDIFAPVAAYLAAGQPMADLGPPVDRESIVSGVIPRCRFSTPDCVEGMVVGVDGFGNLITNIDVTSIDRLTRRSVGRSVMVELANRSIGPIVASYDRVAQHSALAVMGSRGLLEISINCGNAQQVLHAASKDRVCVRFIRTPSP